jgi:hypothetical protein
MDRPHLARGHRALLHGGGVLPDEDGPRRSNWEQAYLPLGRTQRAAAKLLVDGAGARVAEGAAAGIVFLWIRSAMENGTMLLEDAGWLTWVLLATGVVWVTLTGLLRRSLGPVEARVTVERDERLEVPLPDS